MKLRGMVAALAVVVLSAGPAHSDDVGSTTGAADDAYVVEVIKNSEGSESSGANQASNDGSTPSPYTEYRWELACEISVGSVLTCADWCEGDEVPYRLLGLRDGQWFPLGIRCDTEPPDAAPSVTPALVARAFQRIPLPELRAITQPEEKTLINFDTIFRVEAEPLQRTLTLLGQRVELAITPSTFRWVHGDGTTAVTRTPGTAYPAKDVVHRYQRADVTVQHHVEIVWTARWRLNGGTYQDVDGTVTTVGPATPLQVAEAVPALSGDGH